MLTAATPAPPQGQAAEQVAEAPAPSLARPRLLVTPARLERLRVLAKSQNPQWRRLINWAMEPARQNPSPLEGPNLALAALTLNASRPQQAARLGQLAVACALSGAPSGRIKQVQHHLLSDPRRLGAPERFSEMGFDLLNPNLAQARVWPIRRFTAGGFQVDSGEPALTTAAAAGDTYLVLTSDIERASQLAGQAALTLDWAWEWFRPEERTAVAQWLVAQAKVFDGQPAGCFDRKATARLRLTALAGLAAQGLHPQAGALVEQARRQLFAEQMLPCLRQAGKGGAWFEGANAGAQAGLDLLETAVAFKTAQGEDVMALAPWFADRAGYLIFHLLPGFGASPRGDYLRPAPDGDDAISSQDAGDLVRLQMLMLANLRPEDPVSGWATALLSDRHLTRVLADQWLGLEFLWSEPEAAAAPLTSAPLGYLAQSAGRAFLRSDWSERATWLGFFCGPHFAAAQHLDAGSLLLYRRGLLLARSGTFDGTTSPHALNYGVRTLAHNTVTVYDPREYSWYDLREGERKRGTYANDGGQRAWALFDAQGKPVKQAPWTASGWERGPASFTGLREIYDVAGIEALEDQPRYAYLRGRATAAYQGSTHKVRRMVRHVFLLRPGGPDDAEAAEAVAVIDDLELDGERLAANFVLHFPVRPEPATPLTQLGPGRAQGPGDRLRVEMDGSRLDVICLWPAQAQLRLFGQVGEADSWAHDRNYPPRPPLVNPVPWRAEFGAAVGLGGPRPLMHVLLPGDSDQKPPDVRRLVSDDAAVVGMLVEDTRWPRVLAMRLGEPRPEAAVVYEHDGRASRHLVAGLTPGQTYAVQWREGRMMVEPAQGKGLTASPAGLLSFMIANQAGGGR